MNTAIPLNRLTVLSGTTEFSDECLRVHPSAEGKVCLSYADAKQISRYPASHYVCLDLCINLDRMPTVYVDFIQHRGEEEVMLSIRYFLVPHVRVNMVMQLTELDSHRYFLPTFPGSFKGHVEGAPTTIAQIDEIRIRMKNHQDLVWMDIHSIKVLEHLPDMTVHGQNLVDCMGQRIHGTWPNKMRDADQLTRYLVSEVAKAQSSCSFPLDWSRYGGWKNRSFDATGFFHTHFDGKRWYLVDPEGYAFISNGVCYGARMGVHGFVDRMEELFASLPSPDDPTWKDCWTEASEIPEYVKRNGKASGEGRKMFNFARANMIRAFGPEKWWDAWVSLNTARLKRWGFNTIGVGVNTYADEHLEKFLEVSKMPFVLTLQEFPRTQKSIYRDFPDVFSDEYGQACDKFAKEQLSKYAENPYLIGYFLTNEPEWLFQDSVNPAERVLAYDGVLASKDALIHFLQDRYHDIIALNVAWNTQFSSFLDLKQPLEHADAYSMQSKEDLLLFRDILIQRYCEIPSRATARVAPHHMNLGMRYSRLSSKELAGNEFFSLCSFNCYRSNPTPMLDLLEQGDKGPGLIGEWHIAASEERNYASGLVSTANQEERVKAFLYYAEQALSHPHCVGLHYFEMNDQPLLGRFDGECMQHGLISVCNVPYPELSEAMESLSHRLYALAEGSLLPTTLQGEIHGYHA